MWYARVPFTKSCSVISRLSCLGSSSWRRLLSSADAVHTTGRGAPIRRPWTLEEDKKLSELYKKGSKLAARELSGRTAAAVRTRMRRLRAASDQYALPAHIYYKTANGRPWTTEEDEKLLELREQGSAYVAERLSGRSKHAVDRRRFKLRGASNETTLRSSRTKWSPAEDSTLLKKLQQGLDPTKIVEFLPGRSIDAVAEHIRFLACGVTKGVHEFSDAQVERAIEMRLKELKSVRQIAVELGCSHHSAKMLFEKRISEVVSQKELDSIRRHKNWGAKEEQRLEGLFVPTKLSWTEVALQFPHKTNTAVRTKIGRLGLPAARKKYWAELK